MTAKTCHECLWAHYRDSELYCDHDEVKVCHKDFVDVPTIIERRRDEGVCGTVGRMWSMFTEGNT